MGLFGEVQQILAGAGDLAMIAVALGFWKMDKRVTRLEWHHEQKAG